MKIKNIENTITISVSIKNMGQEDIDRVIEDLKGEGFDVKKRDESLEIIAHRVRPHEEYVGGLRTRGLVNYPLLDDIINLKAICNVLGVPIVSSLEELLKLYQTSRYETNETTIIIPDIHLNNKVSKEVEDILRQTLEKSNKGLILGLEFPSDPGFEDLINDPAKNLTYPAFKIMFSGIAGVTLEELVKIFNKLKNEYGERVRIKLIDLTQKEIFEFGIQLMFDLRITPAEKHPSLGYERNRRVLENILDLLKTGGNRAIWTGIAHVIDLLFTKFKEGKSENKDWINNTVVYLPQEIQSYAILKKTVY